MNKPKKLIEVAMPIKEISAESVRDARIQHGHISSLHKWWARRPLPVCRAIVFASLVPDPLDEYCSTQFKEAVEILLGPNNDLPGDPYKPYKDIPHTAISDKMDDNLRNRLLMFIGKFSDIYVENERLGKKTEAKEQINQFSLIKWENKNNDEIIGLARKLIYVNHNSPSNKTTQELLSEFNGLSSAIKKAEDNLYNYTDRHIETKNVLALEKTKDEAIESFLAKMPKVFDPFAGGGAIPLEAARLGCRSYGNDINPVAHIIQKGSCEFSQKYGHPITFTKKEFINVYGEKEFENQKTEGSVFGEKINIKNRLAHDVEYYANKILNQLELEIGHIYPKDNNNNNIAYYWARTGQCENPTCKAEIPLLRQFYLLKKSNESVYLNPIIKGTKIDFVIKKGKTNQTAFVQRNSLLCPCCNNVTPIKSIKKQSISSSGKLPIKLIAVVYDDNGKKYRLPFENEFKAAKIDESLLIDDLIPQERMMETPDLVSGRGWGITKWKELFTNRQLLFIQSIILKLNESFPGDYNELSEYNIAVKTYLAIWINRIITRSTSFGLFDVTNGGKVNDLFGRQAIPMVYDFPELNPFLNDQLSWVLRVIKSENFNISATCLNSQSGQKHQFNKKSLDAVITDPPYYDAIAYADLSDFFYVWFKKSLINLYPFNFATPTTPKTDECTALKHYHNNSTGKAEKHFENSLLEIFKTISYQTNGLVSIMFAHQTVKAWTTLCNSVLNSGMNLNSSWPVDSESVSVGLKKNKAFLSSSITVSCLPSTKQGVGDYKEVEATILQVIRKEVKTLYKLGFRGADLLTACFGKAVSVFGRYESVEKADGSVVTVAELLEMARDAAFDAIISDIETDDLTKFYIGWLNLFGFSEAIHDDVRRISQIGLSVDISDIYNSNTLVKIKDKGVLGSMADRIKKDPRLGLRPVNNKDIDIAHRLMYMYDPNNSTRSDLLEYISEKAPTAESVVWRVLNSLAELLPQSKDMHDYKLAAGLLVNQDNLLREAKNRDKTAGVQGALDFNN